MKIKQPPTHTHTYIPPTTTKKEVQEKCELKQNKKKTKKTNTAYLSFLKKF